MTFSSLESPLFWIPLHTLPWVPLQPMTVLCLLNYSFSSYSLSSKIPKDSAICPIIFFPNHPPGMTFWHSKLHVSKNHAHHLFCYLHFIWQKCHRHLEFLSETNANPYIPPKPTAPPAFSVLAKDVFIYLGWKAYSLPSLFPTFYSQPVFRFCSSAKSLVLSIPSFHCWRPSLKFHQLLCGLFLKSNQPSCLPSPPSHLAPIKSTSSH